MAVSGEGIDRERFFDSCERNGNQRDVNLMSWSMFKSSESYRDASTSNRENNHKRGT
jgi:hypothetical protein